MRIRIGFIFRTRFPMIGFLSFLHFLEHKFPAAYTGALHSKSRAATPKMLSRFVGAGVISIRIKPICHKNAFQKDAYRPLQWSSLMPRRPPSPCHASHYACPLPCMSPSHACPPSHTPLPCMPCTTHTPAMHAPCHTPPPHHACPLCHTCPLPCTAPPCMPPCYTCPTPSPCTPPTHTHLLWTDRHL